MPNSFDSNITRLLARVFLKPFEESRVLSKNVNTQLLTSFPFKESSGDTIDFKRPTDYVSISTPDGDLGSETESDIITGKATGTVQNYRTVWVQYSEADEAIKMDQLDQLLRPMATRMVTDMELDFAKFMMRNSGLAVGTVGTGVSTWDEVAEAGSLMQSTGIPMDEQWIYACNPYTQRSLASQIRSQGSGGVSGEPIKTALERAVITDNFAGMRVMTATTLGSYTVDAASSDRSGTLANTPDPSYPTAKDTMTQSLDITGFTDTFTVNAGEVVTITGRNRLNLSTRQVFVDETGAQVLWTATVTADAVITGGVGTLIVTGPAIFEAGEAYNTVDSALTAGDAISIGGTASDVIQPNLFWHKQAFGLGFVPMKKLHGWDTIATTEDGIQLRVTRYSDGTANTQRVRFDLRPAYAVLNPFFAGQGFGTP